MFNFYFYTTTFGKKVGFVTLHNVPTHPKNQQPTGWVATHLPALSVRTPSTPCSAHSYGRNHACGFNHVQCIYIYYTYADERQTTDDNDYHSEWTVLVERRGDESWLIDDELPSRGRRRAVYCVTIIAVRHDHRQLMYTQREHETLGDRAKTRNARNRACIQGVPQVFTHYYCYNLMCRLRCSISVFFLFVAQWLTTL